MRFRRKVTTSALVKKKVSVMLWAYSYADLASLFGMKEVAVRQAVHRGKLDPGDLASVTAFAQARRPR